MKDLIKKLEGIRDNYQNHSALREDGYLKGINEAIKQINLSLGNVIDSVCRNSNCSENDHIKKTCLNIEHSKICGSRRT